MFARVWSAFHALVACSLLRTALVSERLGNVSTTPHLINQAFLLFLDGLRSPCDGATRLLALCSSTDGQSRLLSLCFIAGSSRLRSRAKDARRGRVSEPQAPSPSSAVTSVSSAWMRPGSPRAGSLATPRRLAQLHIVEQTSSEGLSGPPARGSFGFRVCAWLSRGKPG